MAKPVLTSVLLVVFLLTISLSFSSARLFNDINLPATVNLVLPCADHDTVLPATPVPSSSSSKMRLRAVALPRRAARKYGPLVLNMLPKGPVPPSGPSKGINSLNN